MPRVVASLLVALLACPGSAAAGAEGDPSRPMPPDGTRPRRLPRLELSILFENDNKLLGLWAAFGEDGPDSGRTHGVQLAAARYLRAHVRLEVELATELYTAQLRHPNGNLLNLGQDGQASDEPWEDRNIYFHELSWLHARTRGAFRRSPRLGWVVGAGVVISNRAVVTPGATGLQRGFHRFLELFNDQTREYRYLRSGGVRYGAQLEAGLRASGITALRPRFRLRGHAEVSVLGNTLPHGTYTRAVGRLALDLGRRRHFDLPLAEIAVGHDVRLYPGTADTLFDSRVDVIFHAKRVDAIARLDGYYGDPHNAFYTYNFQNTTTTFGLGFRMP